MRWGRQTVEAEQLISLLPASLSRCLLLCVHSTCGEKATTPNLLFPSFPFFCFFISWRRWNPIQYSVRDNGRAATQCVCVCVCVGGCMRETCTPWPWPSLTRPYFVSTSRELRGGKRRGRQEGRRSRGDGCSPSQRLLKQLLSPYPNMCVAVAAKATARRRKRQY